MRITYVGKHGQANSNDDEGAVAHALRVLGHEVTCAPLPERGRRCPFPTGDVLLWNKCDDWEAVKAFDGHRALWYWDRVVEPGDPTLVRRNEARRTYVERAMEVATLSFFTDGDWVESQVPQPEAAIHYAPYGKNMLGQYECGASDGGYTERPNSVTCVACKRKSPGLWSNPEGKCRWLPQGFDERQTFPDLHPEKRIPILFTGSTRGCGSGRLRWFKAMQDRWGRDFCHVEHGVHGERLALLIRQAKVVVAPDSPVSDRYWSNRVYGVLGMGGFLLHPWSEGLAEQYTPREVQYYTCMDTLNMLLEEYLRGDPDRTPLNDLTRQCHEKTMKQHLYRHRCEKLIEEVRKL